MLPSVPVADLIVSCHQSYLYTHLPTHPLHQMSQTPTDSAISRGEEEPVIKPQPILDDNQTAVTSGARLGAQDQLQGQSQILMMF